MTRSGIDGNNVEEITTPICLMGAFVVLTNFQPKCHFYIP